MSLPDFSIKFKFEDYNLGRVFTVEDYGSIMLFCLDKNNVIYILPGDRPKTIDATLENEKWVRKALKAFKASEFYK